MDRQLGLLVDETMKAVDKDALLEPAAGNRSTCQALSKQKKTQKATMMPKFLHWLDHNRGVSVVSQSEMKAQRRERTTAD